jgi:initiation factor 1A
MPRNTKGGKKHKQQKNVNIRHNLQSLTLKDNTGLQYYAVVEKNYGHNADVKFIKEIKIKNDNDEIIEINKKLCDCKAIIRGKIAKRCKLTPGDVILVSIREFDTNKVDVIYKYSNIEVNDLIKNKFFDPDFIKLINNYLHVSSKVDKLQNMNDLDNVDENDILFNENNEDDYLNDKYLDNI